MPLPKPRSDESRDEFLQRCMGDDTMNEEFPDRDQRYAVCNSIWRDKSMLDIERKTFTPEFKLADEEGSFVCQFCTFDVIDLDGDVTQKGAFPEGKEILVSAYGHGSWVGALPVGKAVVHELETGAVAEGLFNLKMEAGRDTYEAVKFTGNLQEWSYGFRVLETGSDKEIDEWAEKHQGERPERIIKKIEPYEISPVLKGAGIGTTTLAIKSGLSYADHAEAVLAAVQSVAERTKSLADLRRKEGRDLSPQNIERIKKLSEKADEVKAQLDALLTEAEDKQKVASLFLQYCNINAQIQEVL